MQLSQALHCLRLPHTPFDFRTSFPAPPSSSSSSSSSSSPLACSVASNPSTTPVASARVCAGFFGLLSGIALADPLEPLLASSAPGLGRLLKPAAALLALALPVAGKRGSRRWRLLFAAFFAYCEDVAEDEARRARSPSRFLMRSCYPRFNLSDWDSQICACSVRHHFFLTSCRRRRLRAAHFRPAGALERRCAR